MSILDLGMWSVSQITEVNDEAAIADLLKSPRRCTMISLAMSVVRLLGCQVLGPHRCLLVASVTHLKTPIRPETLGKHWAGRPSRCNG